MASIHGVMSLWLEYARLVTGNREVFFIRLCEILHEAADEPAAKSDIPEKYSNYNRFG